MTDPAPAYYARGTSGLRAWWTLLHPPYTLMHLSFVAFGAALAPVVDWVRLGFTLLAFLLAMGLAAHALDELQGRPLRTTIRTNTLIGLTTLSLGAAVVIGVWGAWHYHLLPGLLLVGLGAFLVVGYNLELWHGAVHTDLGFALAWGAFPVVVAYYAQTGRLDALVLLGAGYGTAVSLVQRHLSTPARALRRQTERVTGEIVHADGRSETLDRARLLAPQERALKGLVVASILLAVVLMVRHLV